MIDFQIPNDLDPETVLICTSCRMEYTARYQATSCVDCGGQLITVGGKLVEIGEIAICEGCSRPFAEGSSSYCADCITRRPGVANPSPEGHQRDGAGRAHLVSAADHLRDPVTLERFATDNPYLQRLFSHELYGRVPEASRELLTTLTTAHPDERFLTAMRVRHGQGEGGFLMITTHFLRYVKAGRLVTILKKDEYWPLDWDIEAEGTLGPGVIRTATGHQFQLWGTKAQRFLEFYRLAQLAMHWTASADATDRQALHDAAAIATVTTAAASHAPVSLAGEIAELGRLRDQDLLSDEEFTAAKQKLLQA